MHVRSDKSGRDKQTCWACIKLFVLTAVPQANSLVMVIISYSSEYQQSHLFQFWRLTRYTLQPKEPHSEYSSAQE